MRNIEDDTPEHLINPGAERVVVPPVRSYVPRSDAWEASKPRPGMPLWAQRYARTGVLPPVDARVASERDEDPAEKDRLEGERIKWGHWRGIQRQIFAAKAECAEVMLRLRTSTGSAEYRAAAQRAYELDCEYARIRVERDAGRPMRLRDFTTLSHGAAGRADDAHRGATPLFDPQAAAANDNGDIESAMGV